MVQNQTSICGLWLGSHPRRLSLDPSASLKTTLLETSEKFLLSAQSITCQAWQAALSCIFADGFYPSCVRLLARVSPEAAHLFDRVVSADPRQTGMPPTCGPPL